MDSSLLPAASRAATAAAPTASSSAISRCVMLLLLPRAFARSSRWSGLLCVSVRRLSAHSTCLMVDMASDHLSGLVKTPDSLQWAEPSAISCAMEDTVGCVSTSPMHDAIHLLHIYSCKRSIVTVTTQVVAKVLRAASHETTCLSAP
jgi:hypothetical protein